MVKEIVTATAVGVRGGQLAIYLVSNGSDVRWKAISQMYPYVAETAFQKNRYGVLRQSQFVFNISHFLVRAEGCKQTIQVLRELTLHDSFEY